MSNTIKFFFNACLCASILCIGSSCKDTDEFLTPENKSNTNVDNYFNFSTSQDIDLIVDYSDFEIYGPVLFGIYTTNPIVNEGTLSEYLNEDIEPIFEAYTDENGKFDATVSLPSYARVLHIVTGNVFIGLRRTMVEVVNGEAKVKVEPSAPAASRATRAPGPGVDTDDIETSMYNLWYIVDKDYKKGNVELRSDGSYYAKSSSTPKQICKKWFTPLGTWNSATGHPNYLMSSPSLSNEVINGMFDAICKALKSGSTCNEQYRAGADLTLIKDSEVFLTALGSFTWWNSSLGYYYYTEGNKPKDIMDLNIIMLFPNTQDGKRDSSWNYQNNIGMNRGDEIQLMYYPNIANGGDLSGATATFPKGTKIGFILKANAWGMIDADHSIYDVAYVKDKKNGVRKYNVWASSTDGLTFAAINSWHTGDFTKPNPNGESRSAKFSYEDKNGNIYTIISFEDACNDKDYDDVIFAVNPANAFVEPPKVEQGKATNYGVYAFEDMWPGQGDYDMNDVVVDFKHEKYFNGSNISKEVFYYTTYQNYVTRQSGLALKLTPQATATITTKKIVNGKTSSATFTKDGNYYYLAEDITAELETTYVFEVKYNSAQPLTNLAVAQPFIWRDEDGRRWEVHIPYEEPSPLMDKNYFGTEADCSDLSKGRYYVRSGNYPFAFYLDGGKAEYLQDILNRENESMPIDTFFPKFIGWSTSNGENNKDWYLHHK